MELMAQLSLNDTAGLQPSRLMHCVQFMMYDRDFSKQIDPDATMEMIYARWVRAGRAP